MPFSESDKIKIKVLIESYKKDFSFFKAVFYDYQNMGYCFDWDTQNKSNVNLTQHLIHLCKPEAEHLFQLLSFFKEHNINYHLTKEIDYESLNTESFISYNNKENIFELFSDAQSVNNDFKKIIISALPLPLIQKFEIKEPGFFDSIIPYICSLDTGTCFYFLNKKSYSYQKDFFSFMGYLYHDSESQPLFDKINSLLLEDKLFYNIKEQKTLFSNIDSFCNFIRENHHFSIQNPETMNKIFSLENNSFQMIKNSVFQNLFLKKIDNGRDAALKQFLYNAFIKFSKEEAMESIHILCSSLVENKKPALHIINSSLFDAVLENHEITKPVLKIMITISLEKARESAQLYSEKSAFFNVFSSDFNDHFKNIPIIDNIIDNKRLFNFIQQDAELKLLFSHLYEYFFMAILHNYFSDDENECYSMINANPFIKSIAPLVYKSIVHGNPIENDDVFCAFFKNENTNFISETLDHIKLYLPIMHQTLFVNDNSLLKNSHKALSLYEKFCFKKAMVEKTDEKPTPRKRL